MELKLDKEWFETNLSLEKEEVSAGMFCPIEDECNKEAAVKHELLKIIAELALQYDELNGVRPENCYEGLAFYRFACEQLGGAEDVLAVTPDNLMKMHKKIYSWLLED